MDFFKFTLDPSEPTVFKNGRLLNGFTRTTWIENYTEYGEFTFIAPVYSGLREALPTGTCVSHIDTDEVMVVENHEIIEDDGPEVNVSITGRSIETFLEQRIVGMNQTWPITTTLPLSEYYLAADKSWLQARQLINDHILPTSVVNASDGVPGVRTRYDIERTDVGLSYEQFIRRGSVYSALMNLLAIDNLGIKTVRPGPNSYYNPPDHFLEFRIHDGIDRSDAVLFSYETGAIQKADYLWSNKRNKNAALVTGRWIEVMVTDGSTGFNKRAMFVDGSDIDNAWPEPPTGTDKTYIESVMQARGILTLLSQNDLVLVKPELEANAESYVYRQDYNIGDIVTIIGNYGVQSKMRVVSYVEIEDENGETGYPTLSVV